MEGGKHTNEVFSTFYIDKKGFLQKNALMSEGKPEDKTNIPTSAGGSEAGTSALEPRAAPTYTQPKGKGGKGPKGPIPTRPSKQTRNKESRPRQMENGLSRCGRCRTRPGYGHRHPARWSRKVTRSAGPANSGATAKGTRSSQQDPYPTHALPEGSHD
ncbi:hypothetical protein ACJJTC_013809 [Scirpophaga incertulas]